VDWPHPEAQWIPEEYNRRKIEGKVPRGRPRDIGINTTGDK
jgi:hypothetical protein